MPHIAPRPLVAVAFCMLLGACSGIAATPAGTGGDPMISDDATFTLQPGATVTLADASHLRYVGIVNDSRCPPDVQCIWAGDAEVALAWQAPGNAPAHDFSLHTGRGDKSATLGARRLTLLSLARGAAPAAELKIERIE